MNVIRLRGCAVALSLLIALSGCSTLSTPSALNISRGEEATAAETNELLLQVESRQSEVHTGRFLFDTILTQGVSQQKLRQTFVFVRPKVLRTEFFLPGLNQTSLLVTIRDDEIHALDLSERKYLFGESSPENVERLLSIPALPEELMLWVTGRVPFAELRPDNTRVTQLRSGNLGLRVELGDGRSGEFEVTRDGLVLNADIRGEGSDKRLFVSQFEYTPSTSGEANTAPRLPSKIQFWISARSVEGEFTPVSSDLNPPLTSDSRLFHTPIPPSFKRSPLDR